MVLGRTKTFKMKAEEDVLDANNAQAASHKKKRSRRRRKPRSTHTTSTTPTTPATPNKVKHKHNHSTSNRNSKRPHDSPMTKRDLYFSLHCGLVSIAHGNLAVARVTMINYDAQVVLDTFVQVPVPVVDFRHTGITPDSISPKKNPQAMSFAQVRQSVRQILRGKIVVGHDLSTSFKALGLTHPTSDIRDASMFRFFQYDQVDGVTQQRVVVQRPLVDLAAEYLQRELPASGSAMDMCMAQLDLYKTFRKEWEMQLVAQGRATSTHNHNHHRGAVVPAVPSYGTRSRTSSFDVDSSSVAAYSSYGGSSTYDASSSPTTTQLYKNHHNSRPRSDSRDSSPKENYPPAAPLLTSENLEMLTQYNRYNHHHHHHNHHVYPPGSSIALSEYSSYTAASESLLQPPHEEASSSSSTTASSSWFRFGPRKSKYVSNRQAASQAQASPEAATHMTSWTEEPEDGSRRMVMGGLDEYQPPYPNHHNSLPEEVVDFQEDAAAAAAGQSSSSWFAFRRPKSPGPAASMERPMVGPPSSSARSRLSSSSAFVKVLEPEDAARSAAAAVNVNDATLPTTPVHLDYYYDGNSEVVLGDEKQQQQQQPSSSWFSSFRRPKSPGPGASEQRPVTPSRRRRSSMGGSAAATTTTGPDVSESSDKSNHNNVLDDSPSSMSRRNSKSLDNFGSAAARSNKNNEDAEKSNANSSWFSFRRSTGKASSKDQQQQHENSKEDAVDSSSFLVLQQQPTLQTVGSEEADDEDDWIREVVGSPRTQEKELRVFTELGFEASLPHNPQVVSRPLKESKWLPRFLRSSKSTTTGPSTTTTTQSEHVEFSAQEEVQGDLFSVQQQQQPRPKSTLNPAFFSDDETNLPRHRSRSFTRDRLETEVTLPTVVSDDNEEASHLDDDLSLSSADMIVAMARDMEQNLAYLTL